MIEGADSASTVQVGGTSRPHRNSQALLRAWMGLYQRAHVLDPRLLTYLAGMYPQRCVCPKGALLLRPRLSHWAFFTLQACAFSTRQPQFCARPDEREKRTPKKGPKRRLQQQLQRRGPHRRAETPPGRRAVGAPKALRSCCRSMSQRGHWALAVAREPVPDPARAEAEASTDPDSRSCKRN